MKIVVIGGGPGGLYTALLTKKARPGWDIEVHEQNQADDTFGFGVVFSDETLDEFLTHDKKILERLRGEFSYWQDIAIHYKGHQVRVGGNGFCGTSRHTLLRILQERCVEEGIRIFFGAAIAPGELKGRFPDADVIVASDGIASGIREHYKAGFLPSVRIRTNRFCWMGSTLPMNEFNYFFRETEHGVIVAHCYQYQSDRSTWVIEMDEATWQGHGFGEFDEAGSKAKLEMIFAQELQGHPLLLNRSHWRRFPRIFCENWSVDNIVIIGDAKASAHFSIGSGTKLAMECAIALSAALVEHAQSDVQRAFAAYNTARRAPCQVIQHNADVSLSWFEHMGRSFDMEPYQFAMVVMCRAKSITYDNLLIRDPDFVRKADDEWYARHLRMTGEDLHDSRPTPMFAKYKLREMELANRVVMSPMAQYEADGQGNPTEWHKVHYASHALGGMGLIFTEMTCPSADARITQSCPGMWTDEHEERWAGIVAFVHEYSGAKIAMQLGHAGRKGSTQLGWEQMDVPIADAAQNWPLVSASPLAWQEGINAVPAELDRAGMIRITREFVVASERAARAGFDMLELHCGHGYLLASFLSPLTNKRTDEYGGSVENRLRFPREVFSAMRAVWPVGRPMSVRVSGSDWRDDGLSEGDLLAISESFRDAGCDLIDVSAGQTVPDQQPVYGRMFQTQFSEAVSNISKIATMTVGAITEPAQVNTILHTRRAELVAIGRAHLWNPYFVHQAAAWYGARNDAMWPKPYLSGAAQGFREQSRVRGKLTELQRKAAPGAHNALK